MTLRYSVLVLATASMAAMTSMAACQPSSGTHSPDRRTTGPAPRVRVGSVLRLARAGVLQLVRQGNKTGIAAMVPADKRSGGWQRAIDSQSNQFRVSPAGLIVTDGEPRTGRQPASVANVAYYFTQAYALMAKSYRRQGLQMAAEVLVLPPADPQVKQAQRALCGLFSRLSIRGAVRQKLYRNLVAVAHRVPAGARLTNYVHSFAVTAPLSWRVMAATGGKLRHDTTIMAFSLPQGQDRKIQANLLWTTRKMTAATRLVLFARKQLLTTAGSRVRTLQWNGPALLGPTVAYEVYPVKYKGRRLRSIQIFFAHQRRIHHLNLLLGPSTPAGPQRKALTKLLTTFRALRPPNPCR
jgi:hypothetical protein